MGFPFLEPATTQSYIDSVRFLVGDTDTTDQQLQDGEIVGLLCQNATENGNTFSAPPGSVITFPILNVTYNVYEAAVSGCISLAARYARRSAMSAGDLSISAGSIAKNYRDQVKWIRTLSQRQHTPTPYAGGMLRSEAEDDRTNDDLRPPQFSVGMDDNPDHEPSIEGGGYGFSQAVPSG